MSLARPPEWPRFPERRHVVAFGVVIVLVVLAPIGVALYFYGIGEPRAGTFGLATGVLGLLVAWVGYETRLHRRASVEPIAAHRGADGTTNLEIPYSPGLYLGYGTLMGGLAALFAGAAYALGTYVFAALALVFASLPVLMLTGRFARGRLRLSPEGVHQRGWTFESFLAWRDLVGIFPRYADGPVIVLVAEDGAPWTRRQVTRLWRQDRLPGTRRGEKSVPMIVVPGKYLAVDPALVYHLLGYYLENAAARAELGTDAAVRRARAAAFG